MNPEEELDVRENVEVLREAYRLIDRKAWHLLKYDQHHSAWKHAVAARDNIIAALQELGTDL